MLVSQSISDPHGLSSSDSEMEAAPPPPKQVASQPLVTEKGKGKGSTQNNEIHHVDIVTGLSATLET